MRGRMQARTHTHKQMHTHSQMYTHTHKYTHTHTHTHTQSIYNNIHVMVTIIIIIQQ